MQKNHRNFQPGRSIDGFTPASNTAPRRIGFDVARPKPAGSRPAVFPAVGQTLSSYQPSGTVGVSSTPQLPPVVSPISKNLETNTIEDEALKSRRQKRRDKRANKKKQSSRRRFGFTWKRAMLVVLLLILGVGGWLGFKFIYNTSKVLHGNVLSILSTTKLKGEDSGRVNILLAGNSADDAGHNGAQLTDSIMILSVDTKNNTGFMLSVPRDLWVEIPGFGHAKINEAYVDGETEKFNQSGYFGGGMGLLQEVIQDNFGINLNYYGLVDYNALRDMVNAVGGIDFNVQSTDSRGLYDPSVDYVTHGPLVKLTNGVHTLTGEQALDLARARGDAYGSYGFPKSDFDRTDNQRKELLALRSKILTTGVLANPVKISSLLDAIGGNVQTDFTPSEIHRLYDLVKGIPSNSIQSIGLNDVDGKNLLDSYTSPAGQSALIPALGIDDFTDIESFIKRETSSNLLAREDATIVVLNATDTTGLASKADDALTAKGLNVLSTGDASANQATTSIIDVSNNASPQTKKYLVSTYGNNVTTTNPYGTTYDADYIIILGADQIPKTATSTTSGN